MKGTKLGEEMSRGRERGNKRGPLHTCTLKVKGQVEVVGEGKGRMRWVKTMTSTPRWTEPFKL